MLLITITDGARATYNGLNGGHKDIFKVDPKSAYDVTAAVLLENFNVDQADVDEYHDLDGDTFEDQFESYACAAGDSDVADVLDVELEDINDVD